VFVEYRPTKRKARSLIIDPDSPLAEPRPPGSRPSFICCPTILVFFVIRGHGAAGPFRRPVHAAGAPDSPMSSPHSTNRQYGRDAAWVFEDSPPLGCRETKPTTPSRFYGADKARISRRMAIYQTIRRCMAAGCWQTLRRPHPKAFRPLFSYYPPRPGGPPVGYAPDQKRLGHSDRKLLKPTPFLLRDAR